MLKTRSSFTDVDYNALAYIITGLADRLDGKFTIFESGGGFKHLFVKLKDGRWVGFHSEAGDITITTEAFDTTQDIYNAFWEEFYQVTFAFPADGGNLAEYEQALASLLANKITLIDH